MTADLSAPVAVSKPKRYHPALVVLHWLTLILIFATFFLRGGEGGGEGGGGSLIPNFSDLGLHMILGIIVLLLLIIRLVVRWRTKRPDWASTGNSFLDKVGELTHWALYLFTFGMVITGIILAMQGNRLFRTFGIGGTSVPQFAQGQRPPEGQFQPGQFPPPGGGEGEGFRPGGLGRGNPLLILGRLHGVIWVVLFLLILLHVGAAFYHQFFVKDNLMERMWFGKRYG